MKIDLNGPLKNLRLNLGSGRTYINGWVNIDVVANPMSKHPPDILSDIRKIALPDGCAEAVMAIHVWEHVNRWECDDTIEEWKRLLQPGGKLILEMPDLMKCCRNILNGLKGPKEPDQLGMWGLFGDYTHKDPLMMHAWGWTFATLGPFLAEHGFIEIVELSTEFHRLGKDIRDFRIEAIKR